MQNTVLASIEFYFKGNRYDPSAVIDLDACMRHEEPVQHIYRMLAAENGISSHSYEFEVMVMEDIVFSEPTGIAIGFICAGALDVEGLHIVWQQEKISRILQPIARRRLGIENLNEHPDLKAALIEAYQAG